MTIIKTNGTDSKIGAISPGIDIIDLTIDMEFRHHRLKLVQIFRKVVNTTDIYEHDLKGMTERSIWVSITLGNIFRKMKLSECNNIHLFIIIFYQGGSYSLPA
jgi:hypothetical protein